MTDGEQNRDPTVDGTGRLMTNPALNLNSAPYNEVQIFTIGVGIQALNGAILTLSKMPKVIPASTTYDGDYFYTLNNMTDLITVFCNHAFNKIFQNSSPQLVGYEQKALVNASLSSSFSINKYATQLFFEAVFEKPVATNYTFRIERNGVDVSSKGRLTKGPFFAT